MLAERLENGQFKALGNSLLVDAWDSKDVEKFVGHFAKDGLWIVNNAEPAKGREQITTLAESLMCLSDSSRHYALNGFSSADELRVIVSGKVDYLLKNTTSVTCSFCDVFKLNDKGLIVHAETFMDTSPLA